MGPVTITLRRLAMALLLLCTSSPLSARAAAEAVDSDSGAATAKVPWMHRDRLFDVTFVGRQAWVVGYPGLILHSSDGGASWERQREAQRETQAGNEDEALFSVDFVNEKVGWITGRRGLILHTDDGGASWKRQASGTAEPLLTIDFVDAEHGWIAGNFALILRTTDGGATWESTTAPPPSEQDMMRGAPAEPVLNAISFIDTQRGWVFGEFGTIAVTADGGKTWTRQLSGTDRTLFGGTARDAQRVFAVGSKGLILVTADGGTTWTKTQLATHEPLLHAALTAGGALWACGRGGILVRPSDGAYHPSRAGTYVWLAAIAFGKDGHGLAVGRAGTILRTTDGGETWAVLPTGR